MCACMCARPRVCACTCTRVRLPSCAGASRRAWVRLHAWPGVGVAAWTPSRIEALQRAGRGGRVSACLGGRGRGVAGLDRGRVAVWRGVLWVISCGHGLLWGWPCGVGGPGTHENRHTRRDLWAVGGVVAALAENRASGPMGQWVPPLPDGEPGVRRAACPANLSKSL
jgi:hypothetical protein